MTRQQFELLILRFFGLTEALRSDQSHEGLRAELQQAISVWAGRPMTKMHVAYTFADRCIAYSWTEDTDNNVWEIPWSRGDGGEIVFGQPVPVKRIDVFEPLGESKINGKQQRFSEQIEQQLTLHEAAGDGRRVRAIGVTADVVNGNQRRYRRSVLASAVEQLNNHLHESAGQGRLIATGEAEHPSDKGGRSSLLETVVKWEAASLDSAGKVLLEGAILPTSKGRDIQVLVEHGVPVGVSMRGYGSSMFVKESGQTIQEVTELTITGFDLVAQPSDPNGRLLESQQEEGKAMNLEELLRLLQEKPELRESLLNRLGLADKASLAESLGVKPDQLEEALGKAQAAQAELAERKRTDAVDAAIAAATKDLPYGDALNKLFVESARAATGPATVATDVAAIVESKRKEYDAIAAAAKLAGMGKGVQMVGPVFERETGLPLFVRPAWEITESIRRSDNAARRDVSKGESRAEIYAQRYLKLFDERYQRQLQAEARLFEEAEQTTDLALPYSVMRAIVEQVWPELIAANVYDMGIATQSPERLYFEAYTAESGATVAVTDEPVTGDHGNWVDLANGRIEPGTVVLTSSPAGTTYVEGVSFVIDYAAGKIMTLAAGATTDGQSLLIDYTYNAMRKGEMAEIERAKNVLTYKTLEISADRMATQISSEAVVFSRSQLGYDAVGRTLSNLVRNIQRKIDTGMHYLAIAAALQQASNSGGTWTAASDDVVEFVEKLGIAKTKVYNRYYTPTAIVMSQTNADRLSNWDGFTRSGFPNAVLTAAGFAGGVKGLPIFATPTFPDAYALVVNREVVMHRVFQPMTLKGPFPTYSNGKMVAADQYYVEEYNGTDAPVVEKAAYVAIA